MILEIDVSKYFWHSCNDKEIVQLVVKDSRGDPEVKERHIIQKMRSNNV
jgi:hypothetical protein